MTDIYDRAAATVQRMLKSRDQGGKGAEITITRTSGGTYNEATGIFTPSVSSTYTGLALRENYQLHEIDGTLIQQGDARFLIAPFQLNGAAMPIPEKTDVMSFWGSTWLIVSATPLDYAGKLVAITVQARK